MSRLPSVLDKRSAVVCCASAATPVCRALRLAAPSVCSCCCSKVQSRTLQRDFFLFLKKRKFQVRELLSALHEESSWRGWQSVADVSCRDGGPEAAAAQLGACLAARSLTAAMPAKQAPSKKQVMEKQKQVRQPRSWPPARCGRRTRRTPASVAWRAATCATAAVADCLCRRL